MTEFFCFQLNPAVVHGTLFGDLSWQGSLFPTAGSLRMPRATSRHGDPSQPTSRTSRRRSQRSGRNPYDIPISVGLRLNTCYAQVARCDRMNGPMGKGCVLNSGLRKHGCPHPKSTTFLESFEVKVHPKTGNDTCLCYGLNPIPFR